jgi:hypothetical protein
MGSREEAHLGLPGPVIAGKLVNENHWSSMASLFYMKHRAVARSNPHHAPSS